MALLFFIMAGLIVASGIGVVVMKNPIHSALALVVNLMTVAGIFAQLEAHFLAAAQIIVYAGAIMVLVLFVLMLLNLKVEKPTTGGIALGAISALVGLAFVAILVPGINEAFRVFPDPANPVVGSVEAVGTVLYTKYLFPFEAASILIMVGIVGAVMLAKRSYGKEILPPVRVGGKVVEAKGK